MAGYPKRSLIEKLGIKPGHRIAIRNAPPGYGDTLGKLPASVSTQDGLDGTLDFVACSPKSGRS